MYVNISDEEQFESSDQERGINDETAAFPTEENFNNDEHPQSESIENLPCLNTDQGNNEIIIAVED